MTNSNKKIRKLEDSVIRLIAAGEVVEGPSSVVKELTENSIDSGAKNITIEIKNGGQDYIQVADDGEGMSTDDLLLCTNRHTTSKIFEASDLEEIHTLGFRGEFLASLAAIAKLSILTKHVNSAQAFNLQIGPIINNKFQSLSLRDLQKKQRTQGTTIEVFNLFSDIPARKSFMKSPKSDTSKIIELIHSFRLASPTVKFTLKQDRQILFQTQGVLEKQSESKNIFNGLIQVLGKDTAKNLIEIKISDKKALIEDQPWIVSGWIGKPSESRPTRQHQYFLLNGRLIKSKILSNAIEQGYGTFLARKQFPIAIIFLTGSPKNVDVNVHPAKLEVRFRDENLIFSLITELVKNTLMNQGVSFSPITYKKDELTVKNKTETINIVQKPLLRTNSEVISPKTTTASVSEMKITKDSTEALSEIVEEIYDPMVDIYDESTTKKKGGVLSMNHVIKKSAVKNLQPVAQFRNLYIIAEDPENPYNLYLIDQHAVAERIALEELLRTKGSSDEKIDRNEKSSSKREIRRQKLLVPLTVNLSPQSMDTFREVKSLLLKFGYRGEEFGTNSVLIHSLPLFFGRNRLLRHSKGKESLIQDFRNILDSVSKGLISDHSPLEVEIAKLIACKNSIKAGDYLDHDEMVRLLKKIADADFPFVCCHGRPAIFEINNKEIDKLFWR
ncbi:MAG: DNA mismatch repair protein MutL [Candidatus Heimdallarchaeota archaeon LC_3]|nr:MAG: DNA mismatch repair protein MutL [Candidatus Heimdallarchaeota archaeon LC_3]